MSTDVTTAAAPVERATEFSVRGNLGRAISVIVPILIWFAPLDIEATTKHGLAIASFMIVAWITEALDHSVAGLIGCYLFWALKVVPFDIAFTGFANDTAWFLFGAALFGAMATKSGLARRIAFVVIERVGNTYPRVLLGLIVTNFLLTFLIPSGLARVVIMAAIALGLIEAFGVGPGSNIGRGMFLIITYTAGIFDKMIIAGAASITARGGIEKFGGVDVLWSKWFFAFLPCDVITILIAWWLTLWLYPPEKSGLSREGGYIKTELQNMGSWTLLEKRTALLMSGAVVLWLTDFVHHVSPSVIGLGVGLLAVVPGIGVLNVEDVKRVNYLPVFFVGSAISMGEVLVRTKGLDVLTKVIFAWMEPLLTNIWSSTFVLYWTGFIYHLFLASEISMLGTSVPLLMNFAKSRGLDPLAIGMVWTFAAAGKIFAYQSSVLLLGYSYGYFRGKDLFRLGLWLTAIESLLLLLLVPLYWPLIGI